MEISGTLHLYSGGDRELFFVFDDDVAQELYGNAAFNIDDIETRRVYVSVGSDRFIHRRTLSFSRNQTEIKVSLCSKNTSDGLGALTLLYDWYVPRGQQRPEPFGVIGELREIVRDDTPVWELWIDEAVEQVEPPGLARRRKRESQARKAFNARRLVQTHDLVAIGRLAEEIAWELVQQDYSSPEYQCDWRREYLDSDLIVFRENGLIADIDVWRREQEEPIGCIEVKAQKVGQALETNPQFYLSYAEVLSWQKAHELGLMYELWLFQYRDLHDLKERTHAVQLLIYESLDAAWCEPSTLCVRPTVASTQSFEVSWE